MVSYIITYTRYVVDKYYSCHSLSRLIGFLVYIVIFICVYVFMMYIVYCPVLSDAESAVFVHELAREKDPKLIPPLAQLYLDGETCNGLGDVFYVLAVTIKRLKDSKVSRAVEFEAYTTLVTLLSDSGLPQQAEIHLQKAKTLEPDRAELKIRGGRGLCLLVVCLMTAC